MKETKKSRPSGNDTRAATETAAFDGAAVPYEDSTTAAEVRQTGISALLMHGAGNGIRLKELVQMTGTDPRTIRLRIESERRCGIPILADCKNGYFLPDDEGEKARCVQSMRGRAMEILKTAAALEQAEV